MENKLFEKLKALKDNISELAVPKAKEISEKLHTKVNDLKENAIPKAKEISDKLQNKISDLKENAIPKAKEISNKFHNKLNNLKEVNYAELAGRTTRNITQKIKDIKQNISNTKIAGLKTSELSNKIDEVVKDMDKFYVDIDLNTIFDIPNNIEDGYQDFMEGFNVPDGEKLCGIPNLDILYKNLDKKDNTFCRIVYIKNKNEKIEKFINTYKLFAEDYGKIFDNTFADYPQHETLEEIYEALDNYIEEAKEKGVANLVNPYETILNYYKVIPEKYNIFFLQHICPTFVDSIIDDVMKNVNEGEYSNGVIPACTVFAIWLNNCKEIFDNLPRFYRKKLPQKIYYKGNLNFSSCVFLAFLCKIGCNIILESDNPEVENIFTTLMNQKLVHFDVLNENKLLE